MTRAQVKPELLRWAAMRCGLGNEALSARFPQLEAWLRDEKRPTFKQLEAYGKVTHTPFGFFFLDVPPLVRVPIPDFRTRGDRTRATASPDLLDTVYQCQQRQDWYRDFAQLVGEDVRSFVGSVRLSDRAERVAETCASRSGSTSPTARAC